MTVTVYGPRGGFLGGVAVPLGMAASFGKQIEAAEREALERRSSGPEELVTAFPELGTH